MQGASAGVVHHSLLVAKGVCPGPILFLLQMQTTRYPLCQHVCIGWLRMVGRCYVEVGAWLWSFIHTRSQTAATPAHTLPTCSTRLVSLNSSAAGLTLTTITKRPLPCNTSLNRWVICRKQYQQEPHMQEQSCKHTCVCMLPCTTRCHTPTPQFADWRESRQIIYPD